jgi:hypothetical protein
MKQLLKTTLIWVLFIGLQSPFRVAPKYFNACVFNDSLCANYKLIKVKYPNRFNSGWYVIDSSHYLLKLDTLHQVQFWRSVMALSPDSVFCYTLPNRNVICMDASKDFASLNASEIKTYKNGLRAFYNIDTSIKIVHRSGLKHFYNFNAINNYLNAAIIKYMELGVDPWYAQSILMIESPNVNQCSASGACGPFQLMPKVARRFGLVVSKTKDERNEISCAAHASASLIKTIAIPQAHRILNLHGITTSQLTETAYWFKLLVLHIYNAGAYNVEQALNVIQPKTGDLQMIFNLWHAKAGQFQNASQNYSQLAIAAWFELDQRIQLIN